MWLSVLLKEEIGESYQPSAVVMDKFFIYKFNLVHLIAYQNQTYNLVSKGTEYNQVVTVWECTNIEQKLEKQKKYHTVGTGREKFFRANSIFVFHLCWTLFNMFNQKYFPQITVNFNLIKIRSPACSLFYLLFHSATTDRKKGASGQI